MSIYIPNPNDPLVQQFIEAHGPSTGSINDRFAGAIRNALGITDSKLQIDDLWKIYLKDTYGEFRGLHVGNYESEADFEFRVSDLSLTEWHRDYDDLLVFIKYNDPASGTTIDVSGAGVDVNYYFYHSQGLVVSLDIAADAALGTRTVTLTRPDTSEEEYEIEIVENLGEQTGPLSRVAGNTNAIVMRQISGAFYIKEDNTVPMLTEPFSEDGVAWGGSVGGTNELVAAVKFDIPDLELDLDRITKATLSFNAQAGSDGGYPTAAGRIQARRAGPGAEPPSADDGSGTGDSANSPLHWDLTTAFTDVPAYSEQTNVTVDITDIIDELREEGFVGEGNAIWLRFRRTATNTQQTLVVSTSFTLTLHQGYVEEPPARRDALSPEIGRIIHLASGWPGQRRWPESIIRLRNAGSDNAYGTMLAEVASAWTDTHFDKYIDDRHRSISMPSELFPDRVSNPASPNWPRVFWGRDVVWDPRYYDPDKNYEIGDQLAWGGDLWAAASAMSAPAAPPPGGDWTLVLSGGGALFTGLTHRLNNQSMLAVVCGTGGLLYDNPTVPTTSADFSWSGGTVNGPIVALDLGDPGTPDRYTFQFPTEEKPGLPAGSEVLSALAWDHEEQELTLYWIGPEGIVKSHVPDLPADPTIIARNVAGFTGGFSLISWGACVRLRDGVPTDIEDALLWMHRNGWTNRKGWYPPWRP